MEIVDAQLHASRPDCEQYPWDPDYGKANERQAAERAALEAAYVTAEDLLVMMRAVGVDAAMLVSPRAYADNHDYAFDSAQRYPDTFGVIGPVTMRTPDVENYVRSFRERPGGLGIRFIALENVSPIDPAHRPIFAAAEKGNVPVIIHAAGHLKELGELARTYPELLIVADHFGHRTVGTGERNFDAMADLLDLAKLDNVAVKATGGPKFSRQPYPYVDIWPQLEQIFEAFGLERVMWGSDITVAPELTYAEAVGYLRYTDHLSESEKAQVMGKSLRTLFRWPAHT